MFTAFISFLRYKIQVFKDHMRVFIMDILEKIQSIESKDHYLRLVKHSYDAYINGFIDVINNIKKSIETKQFDDLVRNKLQMESVKFDEASFLQSACELTVMSEFLCRQDTEFVYEKKVTSPKDVDFSIRRNGICCNVEVKCPSYTTFEKEENSVQIIFTNRAPSIKYSKEEILSDTSFRLRKLAEKDAYINKNKILSDIESCLSPHGKTIKECKNLDNTLKDFLLSSQAKVAGSAESDVNVLAIGCNDEIDMQMWRSYLFGNGGFFTDESTLLAHTYFDRVDYVLLTNIYNRHHRYYNDNRISDHWRLDHSFNLLYPNKYSKRNKFINGDKDIFLMNELFPNHNIKFEEYMSNRIDLPEGESYLIKEQSLGIAWYADKFKSKGIFYFKKN